MALTPQQRRRRAFNALLLMQMSMAAYASTKATDLSEAAQLLATWADSNGGLAFDFTDISGSQPFGSGKIIDGASPSNNWETSSTVNPFDKLTWTGASLRMCYGSDGVLRFSPHNWLQYSNAFDNAAWTNNSNVTLTASAASDPFGGSTAYSMAGSSGASNAKRVGQNVSSGIASVSVTVYAKAGTHSVFQIYENLDAAHYANFDLSAGALGNVGATTTASITAIGDGWYRCIASFDVSGNFSAYYQMVASTSASWGASSTSTNTMYLYGAHVYRTPVHSTDYIATTSSAVYRPRIDYDPFTLAVRGLLVEEQRVNLNTYSQEFDNAAWTKNGAAITSNAIVAPDGTTTADRITSTVTGANAPQAYQIGKTISSATAYTASCYLKAGDYSWGIVNIYDTTDTDRRCYFNLSTGVVGTVASGCTASIQNVGNGWYRCIVTKTSAAISGGMSVEFSNADATTPFVATSGLGIYLWGAQYEAGSFATSYIPTTSASATRAADAVSLATSAFNHSATVCTLYAYGYSTGGSSPMHVAMTDGTTNEVIQINGTTSIGNLVLVGGATQANIAIAAGSTSSPNKKAYAAQANSFQACVDGTLGTEDTSGTMPTVTTLYIGNRNGAVQQNGYIRQVMHLPRRLTNTELQTLTT